MVKLNRFAKCMNFQIFRSKSGASIDKIFLDV